MIRNIFIALVIEFSTINTKSLQDMLHQAGRIILPLTVAQCLFTAKIISNAKQVIMVAITAAGNFGCECKAADGSLVFKFAFGQVLPESGCV